MAGIHAGHRGRMRERAMKAGLSAFHPHEVIELLLMAIIPQKNVNPLAHDVINTFGSVRASLAAPEKELMDISGIGPRSAELLHCVAELAFAYIDCCAIPQQVITNSAQAIRFLRRSKLGNVGDFAIVCLDHAGHVLHHGLLPVDASGFPDEREMIKTALLHHASQVFSTHRSFAPKLMEEEQDFAIHAADTFSLVEMTFLDHIVYAGNTYYSARRAGIIDHISEDDALAAEDNA